MNESDAESDTFKNFLEKIKDQEVDFLIEMKEMIDSNRDEKEIIDFLIEKLVTMFIEILIENI
ncbi:hypothetical protein ABW636_06280 [Aquimarina sp. 2201CG1-2-11]|uniref:hypothetical protein n=1 Tax=Aquimarina discodermiae TaxID=3231043 RepID=UPI0034626799